MSNVRREPFNDSFGDERSGGRRGSFARTASGVFTRASTADEGGWAGEKEAPRNSGTGWKLGPRDRRMWVTRRGRRGPRRRVASRPHVGHRRRAERARGGAPAIRRRPCVTPTDARDDDDVAAADAAVSARGTVTADTLFARHAAARHDAAPPTTLHAFHDARRRIAAASRVYRRIEVRFFVS